MIWRNGKSHLEPSLLTDVITKLENSVNSRLQKVAFKYNAVYSQGSFDAISTRSSHTVEMLCPMWMASCSMPSRHSIHLSLGPGPHARARAHGVGSCVVPAPPGPHLSPVSLLGLECYFSFFSLLVFTF